MIPPIIPVTIPTIIIVTDFRFSSKLDRSMLDKIYSNSMYINPTKAPFSMPCFCICILLIELPINMLMPVIVIITGNIVFSEIVVYESSIA